MSDWGATVRSAVNSGLRVTFVLKRGGERVAETTRMMDDGDIVKVKDLFGDPADATLHLYHEESELTQVGINDYTRYKIVVRSETKAEIISTKEA